jgi:hypothetical protein
MKNIKYLFIVLCTIFVFEMISFNKAEAACTVTSGVVTVIDNGCDSEPDLYEAVIYKLYLCTSAPTVPTTSSTVVLTSCSQFFNSASGATVSVASGEVIDLDGTYTRPPNGTYTHGYAYMENYFGVTWSSQIASSMTGSTGGSAGVYCASVAGEGIHQQGSTHTNNSVCSSTDNLTAGKFVETLKHFGNFNSSFTSSVEVTNINGTTAKITGYLVDTNEHLASSTGEVDKLEGLVTFADPITITTETTSLSMKFNVGEGMHLNDRGSDVLQVGSGPFQAIMEAN